MIKQLAKAELSNQIADLLDRHHFTYSVETNQQNHVTMFRLDNECIVCVTSMGRIYMQGDRSRDVMDILSMAFPWQCLKSDAAEQLRKTVVDAARKALEDSWGSRRETVHIEEHI